MKVGFLGWGNMGPEMARNLLKAGHSLTVYNKTHSRAEQLMLPGAKVVPLPLASLIRDRMLAATAQGMDEADWSAIARLSFKEAGL